MGKKRMISQDREEVVFDAVRDMNGKGIKAHDLLTVLKKILRTEVFSLKKLR